MSNTYDYPEGLYNDYLFAGLALGLGANPPDLADFRDGHFLYAFAGTGAVTETAYFEIHILHDFLVGQTPTLHIHWTHNNAAPSGNVKWSVAYTLARGYEADTFADTTVITTTQAAGARYAHHITDDDDLALSGTLEPDAVILGVLSRNPADAADTFADDAFLLYIDLHYQIGQVGTTNRNRTFDAEGF